MAQERDYNFQLKQKIMTRQMGLYKMKYTDMTCSVPCSHENNLDTEHLFINIL